MGTVAELNKESVPVGPKSYPSFMIDTRDPDPSAAINAFLWTLSRARDLGFTPPAEHILAEHLFRKETKLLFYSSSGGVTAICMDESALNDDDQFEMLIWIAERRKQRLAERRAADELMEQAGADAVGDEQDSEDGEREGATLDASA